LFVVGGYGAEHSGFELKPSGWSALPQLPAPRAAAGSAVVGGKLYVVGGVTGRAGLTRRMLVYDIAARRWGSLVGPTPREHLAVTTRAGRIYALGGRTGGFDTNLALFEEFSPSVGTWHRLAPVPVARGGTGMAALGGQIVSVGGEAPGGTISSVYAYTLATRRWRQLPDLGTPRHGLAVVALRGRVYAIGGGPEPGLTVSGVNESLAVGR
jgi:non-specific serine/threonine protein kinase